MSSGKKELSVVIEYINTNKIHLPGDVKNSLKKLITMHNRENKCLADYVMMRDDIHPDVSYWMADHAKNDQLCQLWTQYVDKNMTYRVELASGGDLSVEYKTIKLSPGIVVKIPKEKTIPDWFYRDMKYNFT